MGRKVIKKVVQLVITKERWSNGTSVNNGIFSFLVQGEVKNIGLSKVDNAIIIASISQAKSNTSIQLITKKLAVFKAADYTILPSIKPGQTLPFEIAIHFPSFNSLMLGRNTIRRVESRIDKGSYKKKVYLNYDQNLLDENTREWFKDELLSKIRLVSPKWELVHGDDNLLKGFKSVGKIKNIGFKPIENFELRGYIGEHTENPLVLYKDEDEFHFTSKKEYKVLKPGMTETFEIFCSLPEEDILLENDWSLKTLESTYNEGSIKGMLSVNFIHESTQKSTYRDMNENPAIIQEVEGEKKLESVGETWDEKDNDLIVKGTVRNIGSQDVENCYVIGSIVAKKKDEAFVWETAADTIKAVTIEKMPYLSTGDQESFSVTIKKPPNKILANYGIEAKTFDEALSSGEVERRVELYYHKEDLKEEGLKRLRFGNSYFQLKNFNSCIKEYLEGLKLVPGEKMFYLNLGLSFYKINEKNKAMEYAKKAIELDPKYAKAYYLMGLVQYSFENYRPALDYFTTSLREDDDNARIFYNIGCIHVLLKNTSEALVWFKKAMKADKTTVLSQMAKDPDLKGLKENEDYKEFITSIRQQAFIQ